MNVHTTDPYSLIATLAEDVAFTLLAAYEESTVENLRLELEKMIKVRDILKSNGRPVPHSVNEAICKISSSR